MTKIIAVVNQKGGVGKTTTTINLATAFSTIGKKTLIIDFDPQGNATTGLGIIDKTKTSGSYDVLIGKVPLQYAYIRTNIPNLYILPANVHLSGAEIELVSLNKRESLLKSALNDINDFDYMHMIANYLRGPTPSLMNQLCVILKLYISKDGIVYNSDYSVPYCIRDDRMLCKEMGPDQSWIIQKYLIRK